MNDKRCGTCSHFEESRHQWGHCRFPVPIWLTERLKSLSNNADTNITRADYGTNCLCHQPKGDKRE